MIPRALRRLRLGLLLALLPMIAEPAEAQQPPAYGPRRAHAPAALGAAPAQGARPAPQAGLGPAPAAAAANPPAGPPPGFQLSKVQSERINQLLAKWEQRTSTIKTFRTDYQRSEFDPVFGPKDNFKTISKGEIRYAAPDRGMIQEKVIWHYDAAKAQQGVKVPFTQKADSVGEHWVCDGKSIFEFNHAQKQLVETKLPPEMQGQAIAEGPLPFMFGAKAATIERRYWIREIPREMPEQPFQLLLVPKGRGHAFARVTIYLDPKEFLPDRMDVLDLNGRGEAIYAFENRIINSVADNVKNFWDSFVSPDAPRGWTKISRNLQQAEAGPRQAQGPSPQQR